jgi:predicted DNA-binding protein (UPF0251 family)
MGRPIQPRRVCCRYRGRGFKPIGEPMRELETVEIGVDELEALRLADLEGLYQEAAAEQMAVSRATFARVLARARLAVADALVNHKALLVGPAAVVEGVPAGTACPVHWGGPRRGRGCRCGRHELSHRRLHGGVEGEKAVSDAGRPRKEKR